MVRKKKEPQRRPKGHLKHRLHPLQHLGGGLVGFSLPNVFRLLLTRLSEVTRLTEANLQSLELSGEGMMGRFIGQPVNKEAVVAFARNALELLGLDAT